MHAACEMGQHTIVAQLLAAGASANAATHDGTRPLHLASGVSPAALRCLLGARADVGAADAHKWTALHCACACGRVDVAAALLQAGASATAQAMGGATPLMLAVAAGDVPTSVSHPTHELCAPSLLPCRASRTHSKRMERGVGRPHASLHC